MSLFGKTQISNHRSGKKNFFDLVERRNEAKLTLKFETDPAKALTEAAPSSAEEVETDFSEELVAADAVSLLVLKR